MININVLNGGEIAPVPIATPCAQLVAHTAFINPGRHDHQGPEFYAEDPELVDGDRLTKFAARMPVREWGLPSMDNPIDAVEIFGQPSLRHAHATFYLTGGSQELLDAVYDGGLTVSREDLTFLDDSDEIRAVLPPLMRRHPKLIDEDGQYRRNEFSDMLRLARNTIKKMVEVLTGNSLKSRLTETVFGHGRVISAALYPRLTEIPMLVSGSYEQWTAFIVAQGELASPQEGPEFMRLILAELAKVSPGVFGRMLADFQEMDSDGVRWESEDAIAPEQGAP